MTQDTSRQFNDRVIDVAKAMSEIDLDTKASLSMSKLNIESNHCYRYSKYKFDIQMLAATRSIIRDTA
jgi:hypothetical protein